jgi:sortase A
VSRGVILLERVLYAVGLTLVLGYAGMRVWAEQARAEGVAEVRQVAAQATSQPYAPASADQSLWSRQRVVAYAQSPKGDRPDAVLRIPALGLEVPVYGSTSELNLNRGAGHIEGTSGIAGEGNVGIAAHRDGFFRKLKDAAIDNALYLDDGAHSVRYRIVEMQIVAPEDESVLAPTRVPSVTLVTCYPFYFVGNAPRRFIVRAELDDAHRMKDETQVKLNIQRSET